MQINLHEPSIVFRLAVNIREILVKIHSTTCFWAVPFILLAIQPNTFSEKPSPNIRPTYPQGGISSDTPRVPPLNSSVVTRIQNAVPADTRMPWTVGPAFNLQQAIDRYNIVVRSDNEEKFIITSQNIKVECRSRKMLNILRMSNAELIQYLDAARALKSSDDQMSYGFSPTELIDKAKRKDYFGSEQHVVCSIAASARTGFYIAPEFFIEADPFGGTAGNGPDIENEGYIGEKKSTIAMTHDPDWILGRYFNRGPLSALSEIRPIKQYQLKRMGCFGLVNAGLAQAAFNTGPLDANSREHAINDQIARELDRLAEDDNIYTSFYTLKQGQHGWNVYYKRSYMKGGWDFKEGYFEWDGRAPSGRNLHTVDVVALVERLRNR